MQGEAIVRGKDASFSGAVACYRQQQVLRQQREGRVTLILSRLSTELKGSRTIANLELLPRCGQHNRANVEGFSQYVVFIWRKSVNNNTMQPCNKRENAPNRSERRWRMWGLRAFQRHDRSETAHLSYHSEFLAFQVPLLPLQVLTLGDLDLPGPLFLLCEVPTIAGLLVVTVYQLRCTDKLVGTHAGLDAAATFLRRHIRTRGLARSRLKPTSVNTCARISGTVHCHSMHVH